MQHRRHAEHSPKACMVQKAKEKASDPYREGTTSAEVWVRGVDVGGVSSNAGGVPQKRAMEPRAGGGESGGSRLKHGRDTGGGGGGGGGGAVLILTVHHACVPGTARLACVPEATSVGAE